MQNNINIGVIGLGYVGEPLTYLVASKGYNVIGIDNDDKKIKKVNNREMIPNKDKLNNLENMKLIATKDYSKLKEMDIIIICVPTPTINNRPDVTILKNVIKNVKNYLKRDVLIILESTVAPGMTKKYIEDYLLKNKNMKAGVNYNLAYCPERIDPGNEKLWVGNINRVCGGATTKCIQKAIAFYKNIINGKVIQMESIEEAELIKTWENSMRNISIAESNLLAKICDKYNFSTKRIINGLNSKVEQFGIKIAYPGIGPGGHCIPEDIHYLINTVKFNKDININLLKESVKINENMPKYALKKLMNLICKNNQDISNMKILMLGASYKANSSDCRCSSALKLYKEILAINKNVLIYDPIAKEANVKLISDDDFNIYSSKADILIVSCAHDIFKNVNYENYSNVQYILDCWNVLDKEKIKMLNIKYIGIGE